MNKTKMSLANIQGKLSRTEMKQIMAGNLEFDDNSAGCGAFGLSCSKCPSGCACQTACTTCVKK